MRPPVPITLAVTCGDRSAAWSREDRADNWGQGSFAGSDTLIDEIVYLLAARAPVILPTGVRWVFPPDPRLRVIDVASAMVATNPNRDSYLKLVQQFPRLVSQPGFAEFGLASHLVGEH